MRKPELEKKIHDYILTKYKAEYTGLLEVIENTNEFVLTMGIPSYMCPTTISMETNDEELFLAYVYEELRTRNYMRVEFYKTERTNGSKEE
jgi:hypothetical protein